MARLQQKEYEVLDATSGRSLRVKGYGALRGAILFRKDIDLTRPIAEQALKGDAIGKPSGGRKSMVDE